MSELFLCGSYSDSASHREPELSVLSTPGLTSKKRGEFHLNSFFFFFFSGIRDETALVD